MPGDLLPDVHGLRVGGEERYVVELMHTPGAHAAGDGHPADRIARPAEVSLGFAPRKALARRLLSTAGMARSMAWSVSRVGCRVPFAHMSESSNRWRARNERGLTRPGRRRKRVAVP
jgi:hypothetical protein